MVHEQMFILWSSITPRAFVIFRKGRKIHLMFRKCCILTITVLIYTLKEIPGGLIFLSLCAEIFLSHLTLTILASNKQKSDFLSSLVEINYLASYHHRATMPFFQTVSVCCYNIKTLGRGSRKTWLLNRMI